MSNLFDNPDGSFLVLINNEGQYSLWPSFAEIPRGWRIIFGPEARQPCLDFVEQNWTDMRPKSLIEAMES
ncbi:MAG: MbtH protein [Glomeribacter sp. 1016415]|nr:MbtH protein [Glomeribacter sp. 1016415]